MISYDYIGYIPSLSASKKGCKSSVCSPFSILIPTDGRGSAKPGIATLFFSVAAVLIGLPLCLSKEPASGRAVEKFLLRKRQDNYLTMQCVPEHGQAALSLMVQAAAPMPAIGVQHCGESEYSAPRTGFAASTARLTRLSPLSIWENN